MTKPTKKLFQALHFEITHKCNLRCKHCYNIKYLDLNKKDLSFTEIKKVIDIAKNFGCKDFGFSGGEPFARKDFLKIIKYTPGQIHILTNGMFIDSYKLKKIEKMKKLVEFRVSLDGLKSHKILRNVDYRKIVEKIKLIRNFDFIVTINTMITPYNIDELQSMYDLMKKLNIDRWRIDFIFNSGNAALNNLSSRNVVRSFKAIKKLIIKYLEERPPFDFDVNKFFRSICLEGVSRMEYEPDTKPCGYQKSLTVRPNGDISFCPSLNIVFGNILKDNIVNIIHGKKWQDFANIRIKQIKECNKCKILFLCGGGCRADAYYTTGSFLKADPFTCKAMKYFYKNIAPLINKKIKHSL